MEQSCAESSRMETRNLYLVTCWSHSSTCKHAEFGLYRNSLRAAIWIWYVAGFNVGFPFNYFVSYLNLHN